MSFERHFQLEGLLHIKVQQLLENLRINKKTRHWKRMKQFLSNLFKKMIANNFFVVAKSLNHFLLQECSNQQTFFYFTRFELLLNFFSESLIFFNNPGLIDEIISKKIDIILSIFYILLYFLFYFSYVDVLPLFDIDENSEFQSIFLNLFYETYQCICIFSF